VVDDGHAVGQLVGLFEYWVVRKIVMPCCEFKRRTSSQMSIRLAGSRPVVGSSKKSTRGS